MKKVCSITVWRFSFIKSSFFQTYIRDLILNFLQSVKFVQIVALLQVTKIINVIFKYLSLALIEGIQKETWGESERGHDVQQGSLVRIKLGQAPRPPGHGMLHRNYSWLIGEISRINNHRKRTRVSTQNDNTESRVYEALEIVSLYMWDIWEPQRTPEYLRSVSCAHLTCRQQNGSYETQCLVKDRWRRKQRNAVCDRKWNSLGTVWNYWEQMPC